jgi:hypothetical protein
MSKPAMRRVSAGRAGRGRRGAITRAVAAVAAASLALAGCTFDLPPKPKPKPTPRPGNPAVIRLADAPALLVQCAIRQADLRPGKQAWLTGLNMRITAANAGSFETWFHSHDTPGPYPQTFVIDGHRTHYLAFGATWVHKNGQWVPAYTAPSDPRAERTSIYAWSVWAAEHDQLPPLVCGTSVTASDLQEQVYGPAGNPW